VPYLLIIKKKIVEQLARTSSRTLTESLISRYYITQKLFTSICNRFTVHFLGFLEKKRVKFLLLPCRWHGTVGASSQSGHE
jgi:hypothetical protein